MDNSTKQEVSRLLESAKKCSNKGRLYVYEDYKRQLSYLKVDCAEYDQICRKLANYLRV